MSYEFGFVLSLALLKLLGLCFFRLDTERKPPNYITRVNGEKFFRAGVCALAHVRARTREARLKPVYKSACCYCDIQF